MGRLRDDAAHNLGGMDMQLSKHFSLAELTVTGTGLANVPGPKERAALAALAQNILEPLRVHVGVPIVVTSGFRSRAVNAAVGGEPSSQHVLGEAADIVCAANAPRQLCEAIIRMALPFDQLIQEHGRWVHVSYGPRARRQVLTAVKRRGKTVYLPGLQ